MTTENSFKQWLFDKGFKRENSLSVWCNPDGSVLKGVDLHELNKKFKAEHTSPIQNQSIEKPPLGLLPKKFVVESRIEEIKSAIQRYFEVNKPIPTEWIEEYNELTSDKKKHCPSCRSSDKKSHLCPDGFHE